MFVTMAIRREQSRSSLLTGIRIFDMDDNELLILSAKSVGFDLDYRHGSDAFYYDDPETGRERWDPLNDDGQAFRLYVELELDVLFYRKHVDVCDNTKSENVSRENFTAGKRVSVRRAIVHRAAEIGKSL